MKIIERFATNCPCYKNNQAAKALYDSGDDTRYWRFQCRGPRGLMLHSVGCSQPRADVFAARWDRVDNHNAITHAVLQADGTVYQLLPWNYRAWHCGGSANDTHIGVEMTEPDTIRYPDDGDANFTVLDLEAARAQARGTYATARDLFAFLCDKYGLDPMTDIISHNEGGKSGVASGHIDPEHLWRGLGMSYTMDGFRADVARKLAELQAANAPIQDDVEPVVEPIIGPTNERDRILKVLGDSWIETFRDLPDWAKPEVETLIKAGALKGTQEVGAIEDTAIHATLSFVRSLIVAKRYVEAAIGIEPKEALADMLRQVLASLTAE